MPLNYFYIRVLDDVCYISLTDVDNYLSLYLKVNNNNWYYFSRGAQYQLRLEKGDVLYLKGSRSSADFSSRNSQFNITGKVELGGNIMSLLYKDDFENNNTLPGTRTFYHLFYNCTSIVSAKNLILPATTLTSYCYYGMFSGCTSLTEAPILPATTLKNYCYYQMFSGCSKLNHITMLATDISATDCLFSWVDGVASTGTFVKNSAATWNRTGVSGIPNGWTVENYVE